MLRDDEARRLAQRLLGDEASRSAFKEAARERADDGKPRIMYDVSKTDPTMRAATSGRTRSRDRRRRGSGSVLDPQAQ